MKIGITGVSGFVGSAMAAMAARHEHCVVGFSRNPLRLIPGCDEIRPFDPHAQLDLQGCQALIHLAGESVFGLWTREKKQRILESRKQGTRQLVDAILRSHHPPEVLVSSSAIGFYGNTGERELDESAPAGSGFLAEVTEVWEQEARRAADAGVRVVLLRTGIVLGASGVRRHDAALLKGDMSPGQNARTSPGTARTERMGGALSKMLPVFKLGLGGKMGNGRQWMSWIHLDDLCRLAFFAIENKTVAGPINATAPHPVRNADFTRTLARVLRRPALLGVPGFVLKSVLGEFSSELLESKRIVPKQALGLGYQFEYPELEPALRQLCP